MQIANGPDADVADGFLLFLHGYDRDSELRPDLREIESRCPNRTERGRATTQSPIEGIHVSVNGELGLALELGYHSSHYRKDTTKRNKVNHIEK